MKYGIEYVRPSDGRVFRGLRLTPQEKQIGKCLLQAYSNAEIANEMGITVRTVKGHFNRMFLKANIKDGIKRVKLAIILYHQLEEAPQWVERTDWYSETGWRPN